MKRRATALLVLATILFVVAHLLEARFHWLVLVRVTMEAAMVGGLADWFAVTALFRHPLGLPIPHTAIVATRKDRVGRTLGSFVQRNFLTREVIEGRMRALHVSGRLADWLAEPTNARTIARHVASGVGSAGALLNDEDIQRVVDRSVADGIRAVRIAPVLGRLLPMVTTEDRHQEILNEVIRLAARSVDENRDLIRSRIEKETPWWVPSAIDEKIFRRIVEGIQRLLADLREDPAHPIRARFDAALRDFIERLNTSPEFAARVEAWKDEILDHEIAKRFSASLWAEGKSALSRWADNPDDHAPVVIERALTTFAVKAKTDPELLRRMDDFLVEIAVFVVGRYQDQVGDLIAHTVASWDPDVTSRRVELAIGRDLQFIRINGTIVGGLAGLVIYLATTLF